MSHINFDFLTESFLFNEKELENVFNKYSDEQIRMELNKYREYILSKMNQIREEVTLDRHRINITIESFENRPSEDYLKKLVLYIDCVLIADPLFEMTEMPTESTEAMSKFIGMQPNDKLDRKSLIEVLLYMKESTAFVVTNFLKFIPISILHEAPKEVPIRYDKNGFKDSLPDHVMKIIKEKLDVRNIIPQKGHLKIAIDEPLHKGTMLYLYFPEIEGRKGEIVLYQQMCPDGEVGEDGRFKFKIFSPKSISDYEFRIWLDQSKNTAALQLFNETIKEYTFANGFNSIYLTSSELKARILSSSTEKSSAVDIANLSMKLRLPIIEQTDLATILAIREKHGESFKNFRVALGEELIKLREIEDPDKLRKQLEELSYRINEINVNAIDNDMRKIRNSLKIDTSIITGSLLTSCIANNSDSVASTAMSIMGIFSGLFVLAKETSGSLKELINIKDRPEYFLWKIEKETWKMKDIKQ